MSSAQLRLLPNVHRSLSCCRAVRKPYVAVRAVKGVAVSSGRCLTPPAMFSASAGQRRLSHSFLGCLCGDASDSGTGVTASGDGRADDIDRRDQFALIVVNGELGEFLQPLWRHAAVRICADGGANRVYAGLPVAVRSSELPHCIVGDLDSASPDVMEYYGKLGVDIVRQADQHSTDLHKAIAQLARLLSLSGGLDVRHVVVYGAFGGRFDQLISNLVTLHSHRRHLPADVQMLLLSEGNLAQLVPAGQHVIAGHAAFEGEGKHCGLMALHGDVRGVWTSGLTWELTGQTLGWDAIQSTSNVIRSKDAQVTIGIEHGQLVWTTEFSRSNATPAAPLRTNDG